MNEPPLFDGGHEVRSVDTRGALLAGAAYVFASIYQGPLLRELLGIPPSVTAEALRTSGALHQAGAVALRVPALAIVLLLLVRRDGALRRAFHREPPRRMVMAIAGICVASIALNAIGMWPFRWRYPGDTTISYARILVSSGQHLAIVLWMTVVLLLNPLIEEVIFRFGLLNVFRAWTSSWPAILASASLFAFGHLRALPWRVESPDIVNAGWMLAFGILLGWLAVSHRGLTLPFVLHSSRNALELALIFLVAASGG